MRGELDNGLKIGGRIELEGETTGDQIDQAYLVLANRFGELRIGSVNSGRYSYGWTTDTPAVGMGVKLESVARPHSVVFRECRWVSGP